MTPSLTWLTARDSINSNPVASNITTNSHGADFAWAIFAVQSVVFLALSAYTFFAVNRGHRTFNYLVAAVLACNALNWYAQASNLGAIPVTVEFRAGDWAGRGSGVDNAPTRSIWYVFMSSPIRPHSLLLPRWHAACTTCVSTEDDC